MPHPELPLVSEAEARADLKHRLRKVPVRAIHGLRRKAETGGFNGRCHGRCVVGSLAAELGYLINPNRSRTVVKIRQFRHLLGMPQDPNELTPIEIYCIDVRPEHTIHNCHELRVVAQVCDEVITEPHMRPHRPAATTGVLVGV